MVKKYKKDSDVSYSLGTTLTFELLKYHPNDVLRIYIHPSLKKDETYTKLVNLSKKYNIPLEEGIKPFNILSDKENCFVIGEFKKYESKLEDANHVVLVNPSDMGNLGTIIRSSLGFGVKNIAIIAPGVDSFNPKVVRSSMGARFAINIEYFNSFEEYYARFKNNLMYTLMLQASTNLSSINHPKEKNFSLIFGNEATGLNQDYLNIGKPVIIKHSHDIDSLNLSIALSITLYEFTKNNFK